MNVFDIVIAALLLFGLIKGLIKGFFVEVAAVLALILGVFGAIHFSYFVGDFLKNSVSWDEKYISLAAFAGTFILIVIAMSFLGKLLTKLASLAALGIINRILGGAFGTLKTGIILSVVFVFFGKINSTIPFVKKEILENSVLYKPVKNIVPLLFPSIIRNIEEKEVDIF
jgi:membrane protein required for colicin V production